ncbi:ArnT family glycosyltransferase [Weissella oryzae]|nr:glycosyltransferase family 39 protein [Weissella oryzae]
MVIIQIITLLKIPTTVYHDPLRVYFQAEQLATGNHNWGHISYFWRYPNNAGFAIMLSWIFKVTNFLGISTNFAVNSLALILYDGLIVSLLYMAKKLQQSSLRRLGIIAFFALAPLSYTYAIHVFYTDTPSLIFLAWIIYLLIRWPQYSHKKRWITGPLLVLFVLLGQLTKPNLIVMAIAIVIWMLLALIKNRQSFKKLILIPAFLVLIGFGLSMPVKSAILQSANYHTNTKYELPATSWIYMSLNPKHSGTYVSSDVAKMMTLPDKAARSNYLAKAIPERLNQYNPLTLLMHFVVKLSVLTSSHTLPVAYTGGHTSSPAWYQANQLIITRLASIMQQILWSSLYFIAMLTAIVRYRAKDMPAESNAITLLISLTMLGYAAFHALIWETEERYGLILLPLIFLLLFVQTNSRFDDNFSKTKIPVLKRGMVLTLALIFLLANVLNISLSGRFGQKQTVVIKAQRSQLSAQYGAAPFMLAPQRFLTQEVQLGTTSQKVLIQMPAASQINASLVNLDKFKRTPLKPEIIGGVPYLTSTKALKPGRYQITLSNDTNESQPLWLVNLNRYQLAPNSAKSNQIIPERASLIYTFFAQQHNLPL